MVRLPSPDVQKPITVLFVYLGINVLLGGVLFATWFGTARTIAELIRIRTENVAVVASIAQLANLKQNAREADAMFLKFRNALPDEEQLLFISSELTRLAADRGLEVGFNLGTAVAGSDTAPGTINFTMSLGGTIPQFAGYFSDVARLPYVVHFSSFEVRSVTGGLQVNATGVIYTR